MSLAYFSLNIILENYAVASISNLFFLISEW